MMANQEQLDILKQGVDIWNKWRDENINVKVDLILADLSETYLGGANLNSADLIKANLRGSNLRHADLNQAYLNQADLKGSDLFGVNFGSANLSQANLADAKIGATIFGRIELNKTLGLEKVKHISPSIISTHAIQLSRGKIPEKFLRGCGLSDIEIEFAKIFDPDLTNEEVIKIQYRIYDLRATQALQISPLFISYSHADKPFVDKIDSVLTSKGVRFWRDIHDMKSGRMEKQIDRAMRLNPTVLLILSEHSLQSDWVEHEVRTARALEKEMNRDVLCPVAVDDSWKNSPWSKRIMEQIMEYNILDFSEWKDDAKFGKTFNKLIDGLELFYK